MELRTWPCVKRLNEVRENMTEKMSERYYMPGGLCLCGDRHKVNTRAIHFLVITQRGLLGSFGSVDEL